jgi:hypothetical protein
VKHKVIPGSWARDIGHIAIPFRRYTVLRRLEIELGSVASLPPVSVFNKTRVAGCVIYVI